MPTEIMTLHALKETMSRRPFEPFRVILSSGDSYEVRHPEFAWLVRGGLYVGLPADNGELPERAVFWSLLHFAAIESLADSAK